MGYLLAVLLPALIFLVCTWHRPALRNAIRFAGKRRSHLLGEGDQGHGKYQQIPKGRYRYQMKMDLRKFDQEKWLTVDDNYLVEHEVRARLLEQKKTSVFGCSTKSEGACEEALRMIVENLVHNYPQIFKLFKSSMDVDCIENTLTRETFEIEAPFGGKMPLEIAARLAMEDFNVIMINEDDVHALEASATCFPVGWAVHSRIGWPIYKIHGSVPLWQDKLRHPVERFLSKVAVGKMMERLPYFVQVADLNGDLADILCQTDAFEFGLPPTDPATIIVRGERQTFRRLPDSGAVLFTVKTTLRHLTDLSHAELRQFVREVISWPEAVAEYKGRTCWEQCVFRYCEKVIPDFNLESEKL